MYSMAIGKVAAVQLIGKSHVRSGQPCQDFASGRRRGNVAAIALADGAGSRSHSEAGARTSVQAALRHLLGGFEELYALIQTDLHLAKGAILQRVRKALDADASKLGQPVDELASTLLFAGICKNRFVAGHIGDGAIVFENSDRELSILSHPANGEYANTTFFTTDRNAGDQLRLYSGTMNGGGFALMSDGAAEALYHRETGAPAPAIGQIMSWHRHLPRAKMEKVLTSNLDGPMRKSADDLSLALLSIE